MADTKKVPFAIRISPAALNLIKALAEKKGLSQVSVVEVAVREMAERENVKVA